MIVNGQRDYSFAQGCDRELGVLFVFQLDSGDAFRIRRITTLSLCINKGFKKAFDAGLILFDIHSHDFGWQMWKH